MFYLPWNFQKSRVINCKLNNDNNSLILIREWVIKQNLSQYILTHLWYTDLEPNIKDLFLNIIKNKKIIDMFKNLLGKDYIIDALYDMNEIYVSPLSNNTKDLSDNILYTRHIGGPFFYIPFASCYRVIIGIDDNRDIMTVFNLTSEKYIIKTGDVIGFDFNRECHYITPIWYKDSIDKNNTNNKYRIILKIHYCVYPYWAVVFGFILSKLSIMYNKLYRNLYLFTFKHKYINKLINIRLIFTKVYHDIEYYIGNNNICFILLLLYISKKTYYNVFLFGSSFIHYLRWIDTANNIGEINNILRRDYYFYKFIYMLQFIYMYLSYKIDDGNTVLYSTIIVPMLFTSYVFNYTIFIPKIIEIYMVYDMLNNNIKLKYVEYIYIYINIFLNYIQLYKPIYM
jgi:hypothetical protein